MITGKKNFWREWEKANEIEKEKLVAELPILKNMKCPLFTPNVINSYFEDLYLYMKYKDREPGKSEA